MRESLRIVYYTCEKYLTAACNIARVLCGKPRSSCRYRRHQSWLHATIFATLAEEGACFRSFKLVVNGEFREDQVSEMLTTPIERTHALPSNLASASQTSAPISGTRNLKDNISDLQAQVAANNKGIQLVVDLIQEFSLSVVQAYMEFVQQNAETAVRAMLKKISHKRGLRELDSVTACDRMDDGSEIQLKLTIDRRDGSAEFDFTGTAAESFGMRQMCLDLPISVSVINWLMICSLSLSLR